jgi:glutamate-1-semialdehyde aminotransferase
MWTGFRLALGGAQERYGVSPDLATYSKAIANGMPLSVLTGRADVMKLLEHEVFFFTTFGGETLSLAAAMATIDEIERLRVPEHLEHLGGRLRDGYNRLATETGISNFTRCIGPGCRALVTFDAAAGRPLEMKSLVQQELLRWGVLWSGTHTLSLSHTDADVDYLLGCYGAILPLLQEAVVTGTVGDRLLGPAVEPVFRRVAGFNSKPRIR